MEALPLHCVGRVLGIHFLPFVDVTGGCEANAPVHNVRHKLCHRIKAPFSIHMLWNILYETVRIENKHKSYYLQQLPFRHYCTEP